MQENNIKLHVFHQKKPKQWIHWCEKFEEDIYYPPQHLSSLYLGIQDFSGKQPIWVDVQGQSFQLVTLFHKQGRIAWNSCQALPSLQKGNINTDSWAYILQQCRKLLQVDALYFPHLFADEEQARVLTKVEDGQVLERLPCPMIDRKLSQENIWQICQERMGGRARRRINKFKKKGFNVSWPKTSQAIDMLAKIEKNSWKAGCQQDMFSRGQFGYYKRLIESEIASLRTVDHDGMPVAYRLDQKLKDTLFCLKWSYNESYSRYSPGFYLIAYDLNNAWQDKCLRQINLWGSPDTLKCQVETHRCQRFDFIWPFNKSARELLAERVAHDAKMRTLFENKLSIRYGYVTKN